MTVLKGEMGGEGDEDEEESRDISWKSSFASPSQFPGIGDFGPGAERDESISSQLGPRLVIGRQTDEVWRKGPSNLPLSRDDSMDIDSNSRQRYLTEETTNYSAMHGPQLDSRIRQVASAASAHADAVVRESQHHQ